MTTMLKGSTTAAGRGPRPGKWRCEGRRKAWAQRFVLGISLVFTTVRTARAEDVAVPLPMQAKLLATVADYDKGFAERAKGKVKIVLLTSKQPESARAATQMQGVLKAMPAIGGLAHEESVVKFETGAALANLCRSSGISIVFLMPGFGGEISDIKKSLDGVSTLSVASIGSYVEQGIVLGFDVISGKPKLLVNLPQSRAQKIVFKAELLKMVKVIE